MNRLGLLRAGLLAAATLLATGAAAQVPNTDVKITADNAYAFGWGDASTMLNYFGGVENTTADAIFNCPLGNGPEGYTVSGADLSDYLYIVAWSDNIVTQGVIGRFQTGTNPPLYTGQGEWEVFATGIDFGIGSGGPSLSTINTQIVIANAATGAAGTTSIGWVGTVPTVGREGVLVFGEDNVTSPGDGTCGNPFPLVCATEIDAAARWMWYQQPGAACAFLDGNQREFLIFRIPLSDVVGGDGTCDPRTHGFWKRQCKGPHPSGEDANLAAYASCLAATATFAGAASAADVCDALHPDPENSKCEQAEAQFAALLLNACSRRLSEGCCIDTPAAAATTVGQAIDEIDALLSDPARTFQDCVRAQAIADAINTSAALCP
jgi:hypothetical protein